MEIRATSIFSKKLERLIENGILCRSDYIETRERFRADPKDKSLRPHKINCHQSINLVSITVANSQLRILAQVVCSPKRTVFVWIGKHREYEKIIQNKRNCRKFRIDCEESEAMECV